MATNESWLCRIGLHRWQPIMERNPDPETVWIFGPLIYAMADRCNRCKIERETDCTPPPGDYD